MSVRGLVGIVIVVGLAAPWVAGAYPGGTPDFQTDVAPFCAACHSSRSEEALAGGWLGPVWHWLLRIFVPATVLAIMVQSASAL